MSSPDEPLVDASVHLFFRSDQDLRGYLSEPFRSRGYPDPDVAWFAPPGPRYAAGTEARRTCSCSAPATPTGSS